MPTDNELPSAGAAPGDAGGSVAVTPVATPLAVGDKIELWASVFGRAERHQATVTVGTDSWGRCWVTLDDLDTGPLPVWAAREGEEWRRLPVSPPEMGELIEVLSGAWWLARVMEVSADRISAIAVSDTRQQTLIYQRSDEGVTWRRRADGRSRRIPRPGDVVATRVLTEQGMATHTAVVAYVEMTPGSGAPAYFTARTTEEHYAVCRVWEEGRDWQWPEAPMPGWYRDSVNVGTAPVLVLGVLDGEVWMVRADEPSKVARVALRCWLRAGFRRLSRGELENRRRPTFDCEIEVHLRVGEPFFSARVIGPRDDGFAWWSSERQEEGFLSWGSNLWRWPEGTAEREVECFGCAETLTEDNLGAEVEMCQRCADKLFHSRRSESDDATVESVLVEAGGDPSRAARLLERVPPGGGGIASAVRHYLAAPETEVVRTAGDIRAQMAKVLERKLGELDCDWEKWAPGLGIEAEGATMLELATYRDHELTAVIAAIGGVL